MSLAVDTMAAAEQQIALEHQLREKVVNEEFKIWKKTVPLLYNSIHTHALKWPLLTVDFSPKYTVSEDKSTISVDFVTGTNTSLRDQDLVSLVSLKLPSTLAPDFASFSGSETIPIPENPSEIKDFSVVTLWKHAGEVNRAKFSPEGGKFVTFDNTGSLHLYTIGQESSVDYKFHTSEGYCLEWVSETQFISGANDSQIALWDISSSNAPLRQFNTHSAVINDLSYSKPTRVLFGSVADDFSTQIHDLRDAENSPAIKITERHMQNAFQFHPEISHLFATGGKDNVVNIYDARSTKAPLRQLFGHNDLVFGLRWDTFDPLQLYSWGLDKRVISWDLNYMADEYTPPLADPTETRKRTKNTEDPCLQFIHAGHTNRVNDFAVHPSIPHLFATVGDDTLLEIYQPKTLREGDDQEDDEDAEEQEEKEEQEAANAAAEKQKQEEEAEAEAEAEDDEEQLLDNAELQGMHNGSSGNMNGHLGITPKPPVQENPQSDVEMAD